jgi:hypothetical protein
MSNSVLLEGRIVSKAKDSFILETSRDEEKCQILVRSKTNVKVGTRCRVVGYIWNNNGQYYIKCEHLEFYLG